MKFGKIYLPPIIGQQKSFYGKAIIEFFGDNVNLWSYNTRICSYNTRTKELTKYSAYNYSQTTKRHQIAFFAYLGIEN